MRRYTSVLDLDDLDAAAAGAVIKASEDANGSYQPPPRRQSGPAFSFGVKTKLTGAMVGRCRLAVSKPVLKARMISALEAIT